MLPIETNRLQLGKVIPPQRPQEDQGQCIIIITTIFRHHLPMYLRLASTRDPPASASQDWDKR